MLRAAKSAKPRTARSAGTYSIPAPVGGLNAVDSIADMPDTDALVLDNFVSQPDKVDLRGGYESHATGLGGAISSLMTWAGPSSDKMFGATAAAIYEVTSAGAVGAAAVSSLTNGKWQHAMQETSGGNFLVICNGSDAVRSYDGSSWATPTITGVSSSSLIAIASHKERLWFVEKETPNAWYLGTEAIAGAATKFSLGSVFKLGGNLVAIGSMSRDGGDGPDDVLAFISSKGEVVIYRGTDPSSANTWALEGNYYLPPPIGRRCVEKAGGDLAIITEGGVMSLQAARSLDRAAQQRAAVTSKINRLFMADSLSYRANHGWQVISYPRANLFIVNVPVSEGSMQRQYVMSALTGGWSRWTNVNMGSLALLNGDLYGGGNDGTVYKLDSGYQDNGSAITGDLKTAFSPLGAPGVVKTSQMLRSLFSSNGSPGFLMDVNVDYEDRIPTSTPTAGDPPGTLWGSATWGVSTWTVGEQLSRQWVGAAGVGHSFAVRLRVVSDGASCTVNGFDIIATRGGQF